MEIDINYQKIIKKLKIRLFKSERYFEYFKSFLISIDISQDESTKKEKVYNLIQSKHSIQKKPTKKFWYSLYIILQKPSIEYPDELSFLEEKYLQYCAQYIYKYLCSISIAYSAEIDMLKQEYLNLCIKFINHSKNKRIKTLRIISKQKSLKQSLYDGRNKDNMKNTENNARHGNEKSSDDEDDNEKNNFNKYESKRPKTLLEKELFNLKLKSSNEVVDEFIGDINNDLLINKKKEICFLHFIKTKKNKIFKRFLSKQTKKVLEEMKGNDILYTKQKDKYDTIFSLEMKIKNQHYRNNKKKKEKYNLKLIQNSKSIDDRRKYFSQGKNKNIKTSRLNFNKKLKIIGNKNNQIASTKKNSNNTLSKCFSFNLNKKNGLFLPLLPSEKSNFLKTEKYNNFINKKYYINGNDLFY